MHSHALSMSAFLLCVTTSVCFPGAVTRAGFFLAGLNLLLLSSCIVSGLSRKMCDEHRTG